MFQFLNQLREPYRGRGIGCYPDQSAALFKLPFELFPVALLIHDGTHFLSMRRWDCSITETVDSDVPMSRWVQILPSIGHD